jgi:3-methyl-2-oxobutanoate hydroxymethyltransferase
MITAYDCRSAQVAQEAGVDVVLVGDSGAMTLLGYPSTVPVSTEEMLVLAAAVRRVRTEDAAAGRRSPVRLI